MNSGLKVISPATVSNLACGFDTLGMALDIPCDEIIGRWSDNSGVRITEISGYKAGIPHEADKNIASITATALLNHLGERGRGLKLRIHKHIQGGSGMGSSAGSATAAAVLVNELLNRPLEKRELIPFAMQGEMTASGTAVGDNVVSAMIGGLILIRDILTYDFHRIYTPPGLFMAILLPDFVISTKESRGRLMQEVPLDAAIRQAANLGAFVIGMQNSDLDLIRRSMVDHIIEPQRMHLIPHFKELKNMAMEMGALGCNISGAGPAIFALCQERLQASGIATAMEKIYISNAIPCRSFVSGLNHEGAKLF